MVNWFSAMVTMGLSNSVLAWVVFSNEMYSKTILPIVLAFVSYYIAWREMKDE